MSDVTQILRQIEAGDPSVADQLLPLVYDELRKLAAQRMANESSDHTLQATALVHEAYVRLMDGQQAQHWDSRRHFFAAAAEAMRRILIERARRETQREQASACCRTRWYEADVASETEPFDLLAVDEALAKLAAEAPEKAEVVKLRFYAGLSHAEVADVLGVSAVTVKRHWRYARAWLLQQLQPEPNHED